MWRLPAARQLGITTPASSHISSHDLAYSLIKSAILIYESQKPVGNLEADASVRDALPTIFPFWVSFFSCLPLFILRYISYILSFPYDINSLCRTLYLIRLPHGFAEAKRFHRPAASCVVYFNKALGPYGKSPGVVQPYYLYEMTVMATPPLIPTHGHCTRG